jgi:hypothetical protein
VVLVYSYFGLVQGRPWAGAQHFNDEILKNQQVPAATNSPKKGVLVK